MNSAPSLALLRFCTDWNRGESHAGHPAYAFKHLWRKPRGCIKGCTPALRLCLISLCCALLSLPKVGCAHLALLQGVYPTELLPLLKAEGWQGVATWAGETPKEGEVRYRALPETSQERGGKSTLNPIRFIKLGRLFRLDDSPFRLSLCIFFSHSLIPSGTFFYWSVAVLCTHMTPCEAFMNVSAASHNCFAWHICPALLCCLAHLLAS